MSCDQKGSPELRPYRLSAWVEVEALVLAPDAASAVKTASNWSAGTWEEVTGEAIQFIPNSEDLLEVALVRARARKDPQDVVSFIKANLPTHVLYPASSAPELIGEDLREYVLGQAEATATSLALSSVQLRLPGVE